MQSGSTHQCGGSTYNETVIITAAHRVKFFNSTNPVDIWVTAGEYNRTDIDGDEQRIAVSYVVPHEQYNIKTFQNDIGLIFLQDSIVFNDLVQPILLPNPSQQLSGDCQAAGWGVTEEDIQSDILRKATLQVIDIETCHNLYEDAFTYNSVICVSAEGGFVSVCNSDSGGPLQCEGDNGPTLAGITSFGDTPCDGPYPDAFTKVTDYLDWLIDHL